jgi:putative membrane protein
LKASLVRIMAISGKLLIFFVGLLHVYFLVLEMFLWTKPIGLKSFRMTIEKAKETAVLAANQGLYNGFLAAGLFWSLVYPSEVVARHIALFFLLCVFVAALYGGYSVSRKIFFIQGIPAALAIIALL